MKKAISLFLVICILVVNCIIPIAAEEAAESESKVLFYDGTDEITEITVMPKAVYTVYYSISGDAVNMSEWNWYSTNNRSVALDVDEENRTCTITAKKRVRRI